MRTRGIGDIRGIRSLKTRPGPTTESNGLLKLYQLAVEKDNLRKKLERIERQKDQTERRLSAIVHTMHMIEKTIEERADRESASSPDASFRSTLIKY
jgi:hypothetical protein